jgi:hypothetical protein
MKGLCSARVAIVSTRVREELDIAYFQKPAETAVRLLNVHQCSFSHQPNYEAAAL